MPVRVITALISDRDISQTSAHPLGRRADIRLFYYFSIFIRDGNAFISQVSLAGLLGGNARLTYRTHRGGLSIPGLSHAGCPAIDALREGKRQIHGAA